MTVVNDYLSFWHEHATTISPKVEEPEKANEEFQPQKSIKIKLGGAKFARF